MTPRVAVVSGGSAGLGRAVVRELAASGWDVAVLARGRAGLEGALKDIENAGRRGLAISADVAELGKVESAAAQVERELGPISLWVNVAFVGALRFFWDTPDDVYRRITDVTYHGQVNGTRVALSYMRRRNRGVIVQVGSALAFRGIPLQSAYCGAKHAVMGFTQSVIAELRHEKSAIRVCMLQLPALNTVQFDWTDSEFDEHPMPVPPIFEPEVAARAVRYLADHPRRTMWVGSSTALTIVANRLAPSVLDRYLGKTGVQSQLSKRDGPRFGSNVFVPRDDDADRGARGMFTDKARDHDSWSVASMQRLPVLAASVAIGSVAAGIRRRRRVR